MKLSSPRPRTPSLRARGLTGFSYNLRIGTTPGGVDILSPEADLDTGWRRVTALGNLGENLSANFRLPPGKYYWSVQAVDSGFVGSTFASEQEFNINLLINTKDVR